MHNTKGRSARKREGGGEWWQPGGESGGGGRDAIRPGGLETKNHARREWRAWAARIEAEINRRKSLLPSALSGPFRPAKIIYRKDWCARLLFLSGEFRDGPLGDAEISKRRKKINKRKMYTARERSSRFALYVTCTFSSAGLEWIM